MLSQVPKSGLVLKMILHDHLSVGWVLSGPVELISEIFVGSRILRVVTSGLICSAG